MSLSARDTGNRKTKLDVPEQGTHMARLVGLTDLGHQPGFTWQGKDIESSWKVEFTYELVNSLMADGRPHWVSEDVNVNDFEGDGVVSTMMARVRSLDKENASDDGKNLSKLLGAPCMATISLNEKGYPKLKGQAAVGAISLGMDVPELNNEQFTFDMDAPNMDVWESFADFKQGKIKVALNFDATVLAKELAVSDEY